MVEKNNIVITVGLPKTGTSSMRDALNTLGYRHGSVNEIGKKVKGNVHFTGDDVCKPLNRYKKLDSIYPNAKFILTVRKDKDEWFNSVYRWARKDRSKINNDALKIQRKKMYGHEMPTEKNKYGFTSVYTNRTTELYSYFMGRNKLLIFISGVDGWDKLCKFLNKPTPNIPFPHSNKNQ